MYMWGCSFAAGLARTLPSHRKHRHAAPIGQPRFHTHSPGFGKIFPTGILFAGVSVAINKQMAADGEGRPDMSKHSWLPPGSTARRRSAGGELLRGLIQTF